MTYFLLLFLGAILLVSLLISVALKIFLRAASPAAVSDIRQDETVVFFKTHAWLDAKSQEWVVPIHGWVFEPEKSNIRMAAFRRLLKSKYGFEPSPEHESNFSRRTNLLISDNERGKTLVIKLGDGTTICPKTVSNGHFKTAVRIPASTLADKTKIAYQAVLAKEDGRRFSGEAFLIADEGVSVISDIDDTVKITEVGNRKLLVENTFYKNFVSVDGMAEVYQQWQASGVSFHFVSSSPWYLYEPLDEFLTAAKFPDATLSLKAFRFRDRSLFALFKKGTETKPPVIRAIIKAYPRRQFILVGDSGEQDAEVYVQIAQQYPQQIKNIFIRNVDGSVETESRIRQVLSPIDEKKWRVFRQPQEMLA